jgi:hypothetical protein
VVEHLAFKCGFNLKFTFLNKNCIVNIYKNISEKDHRIF